ncbi:MAG: nucleotidyltransferase family protein [Alphaproteobacteria bacterium]
MTEIGAIVLAAGLSSRMSGRNKLLLPVGGRPMVTRVVMAALESRAAPVIVVTGHDRAAVEAALRDLPVGLVHAADHALGLSASLRRGLEALPAEVTGAVVCLGDMPGVTADHIDALIDAVAAGPSTEVLVPTFAGRRGNPVLWGRAHFAALQAVTGDRGGRDLMRTVPVREVPVADDGVLRDIDSPADLARETDNTDEHG